MISSWVMFLRMLFAGSIALAVIPYGAVHTGWLDASNLFSGLVFVLALTQPFPRGQTRRIFAIAVAISIGLAIWALLQSWQFGGNPLAHPIWQTAWELVGAIDGAISVDPATTRAAIPHMITPFLAFLTILLLYQDDDSLMQLWWVLVLFGAAIAAFAIVQTVFFPGTLLWRPKDPMAKALSAPFVNRNTAATFLGLAALLPLGLGKHIIDRIRHDGSLAALRAGRATPAMRQLLVLFAIMMMDLSAMFMTQSRGGVFATFLGVAVTAVTLATTALPNGRPSIRRVWIPVLVIATTAIGFLFYAARVIRRAELLGLDEGRWCTYRATLAAIGDFPVFGTGFGTFDQVYPHYRILDCAGVDGIWYKAHNVYLEGYLGLGLPFAIAVIIGVLVLWWVAMRGIATRRRYRFASAVLLGALVLVLMHSAVDFSLQIHGIAIWFAAILGITVALSLGRLRSLPSRE